MVDWTKVRSANTKRKIRSTRIILGIPGMAGDSTWCGVTTATSGLFVHIHLTPHTCTIYVYIYIYTHLYDTYIWYVCLSIDTDTTRKRERERETEKNRFPSTPTKGGNSPQHSMIHDYIACYNRRGQALKEKNLISSRIWPTSRHLSIRVMRSILSARKPWFSVWIPCSKLTHLMVM